MQINKAKAEQRSYYKKLRSELDTEYKNNADFLICKNLTECDFYKSCESLLVYASMGFEVDTKQLIEKALDEKNVYCPRCEDKNGSMKFYRIYSIDDLKAGAYGLLEPNGSTEEYVNNKDSKTLCILPGLCMDKNGYRLGFGKGYYDRFLSDFNGYKAGICYSRFVIENVVHDKYDISAYVIVTENECVYIPTKKGSI